jgi:hypothetical protein
MPAALTVAVGDTTQIRAVAALRDDTYQVITTLGTWESSDPAIATVNASGVVRGVAPGTADVTVTLDGLTAQSTVTVVAAAAAGAFWGGVSLPGGDTGTLTLAFGASPRVSGTILLARGAFILTGRLDEPTRVVTLTGGAYRFTGTFDGSIASGTLTDESGATGGFVVVDAGRNAVTPFCGGYVSDGVTPLDNADNGSFILSASLDGTVAATALTSDATSAPLIATGRRSGDTARLTTTDGQAIDVSFAGGTATGLFTTSTNAVAAFNATTAKCH